MNQPDLPAELDEIRRRMTIAYMPPHFTDSQQVELLERMVKLRRVELWPERCARHAAADSLPY